MILLIEMTLLFLISFDLAYRNPNKIRKHAFWFSIFFTLAVPLDYLLYRVIGLSYNLITVLASNCLALGSMFIGLALGGTVKLLRTMKGDERNG